MKRKGNIQVFLLFILMIFTLILIGYKSKNHTDKSSLQRRINETQVRRKPKELESFAEATTEEWIDIDQRSLFFQLLEEKAQIMLDYEFSYGNARATIQREIDGNRQSNCASYISYVLQDMEIIPKGRMFYCNRDVTLKGTAAKKLMKEKDFEILYPDDTVENVAFEPGDIVGIAGKKWQHTMVFVGYREDGRMLWYSGGNDATMRDSKQFSPKKLGVVRRITCYENKHCIMILRWKEPDKIVQYKKKNP
ncbi:MAG: hypothetical protein Q4E53_02485 [Eubacteriales bacterium]|nr:hypothetical protein [Eubacteriales bacterium]